MSVEIYLLDSSALLTLMEDEAGANRVEDLIKRETILIPFMALLEVYYITCKKRSVAEADRRYALLRQVPATFLWNMDEVVMLMAAKFKAGYPISLADSIVAAYAKQYKAILVHKDPEFETLSSEIRTEILPLKNKR